MAMFIITVVEPITFWGLYNTHHSFTRTGSLWNRQYCQEGASLE